MQKKKFYFVLSSCSASSGVIMSGCPDDSRSIIPSELLFKLLSPRSSDNGICLFLKIYKNEHLDYKLISITYKRSMNVNTQRISCCFSE